MIAVAAVAILTVVGSGMYGNRLILDSMMVTDQPLRPLLYPLKNLAARHGHIERISADPATNEIVLVVRAKNLGRARTTLKHWLDARNAKKILSQSESPLIRKLLTVEFAAGSNTEAALKGNHFLKTEYGPYTQYVLPGITDGSVLTLTDRAGILKQAHVRHPNWQVNFFDEISGTDCQKILEIEKVHAYIAKHPDSASQLDVYVEELLSSLN